MIGDVIIAAGIIAVVMLLTWLALLYWPARQGSTEGLSDDSVSALLDKRERERFGPLGRLQGTVEVDQEPLYDTIMLPSSLMPGTFTSRVQKFEAAKAGAIQRAMEMNDIRAALDAQRATPWAPPWPWAPFEPSLKDAAARVKATPRLDGKEKPDAR